MIVNDLFLFNLPLATISAIMIAAASGFSSYVAYRGDDVSSVVDVIPSAPQIMAVQPIVSRSHHLISDLDCQTALCNISNLAVAMLHIEISD